MEGMLVIPELQEGPVGREAAAAPMLVEQVPG